MSDLALLLPPAPPPPIRPVRVVPPPIPLRLGATGCFTGRMQAFRRIMMRGALLRVVTLGIYRFWHTTDTRHFLWANTEIGGDSLEYSGTARELFVGCLMVIALLAPVYRVAGGVCPTRRRSSTMRTHGGTSARARRCGPGRPG